MLEDVKLLKKEQIMNKKIIFKWDKEWDTESVGKCIWKSGKLKGKNHYSFSKQHKNLPNLLEMLRSSIYF